MTSIAALNTSNINFDTEIVERFRLAEGQEVTKFLYSSENLNCLDAIGDVFRVVIARLTHWFETWIWVDETACCKFCYDHELKDLSEIAKIFNRSVAQQYPTFLAEEVNPLSFCEKVDLYFSYLKHGYETQMMGSICPSSSAMGKAMAKHIPDIDPDDKTPRHYLEVGPGTGAFTEHILRKLKPIDQLDLIEIDPLMCKFLRRKYGHLTNVRIHEGSVMDDIGQQKYNCIISGMPMNAFKPEFVREIFDKWIKHQIKPDGCISYFEYAYVDWEKQFTSGERKKDLDGVYAEKERRQTQHGESVDYILWNLPPARAKHLRIRSDII